MTFKRNDRTLVYVAVAALVAIAVLFAGYSYTTSEKMDRSATSAGSSTDPRAPNTLPDTATDKPAGAQTTGSDSNVPPSGRSNR